MKELLDQKIVNVYIEPSGSLIVFENDEGIFFKYDAYGDCCSQSWINDLVNPECLFGHTITKVEPVSMDDVITRKASVEISKEEYDSYECLQAYSYKITTTGGYFDIVFRNSSNGYYSGNLEFNKKKISDSELKSLIKVVSDWTL